MLNGLSHLYSTRIDCFGTTPMLLNRRNWTGTIPLFPSHASRHSDRVLMRKNVSESVADCIRELGYIVRINTASRASGKIEISSIYKLKWDPTSDSAWRKTNWLLWSRCRQTAAPTSGKPLPRRKKNYI